MSQIIRGTFASGQSSGVGQTSAELLIPTGTTTARLTIPNDSTSPVNSTIDASNTVKTQKSTDYGVTWVDQTTYNSAQSNVAVTVAAGEQWRFFLISQQANKSMSYELSAQS